MADLYSDIASLQSNQSGTGPSGNLAYRSDGQKTSGNLHVMAATYTLSGSEAATDRILWGRIPIGAIFIPGLAHFNVEAGASTALTLDVGEGNYDDGTADSDILFGDDIDLASEGIVFLSGGTLGYALTPRTRAGWIISDPSTVTSTVADKRITLVMPFLYAV